MKYREMKITLKGDIINTTYYDCHIVGINKGGVSLTNCSFKNCIFSCDLNDPKVTIDNVSTDFCVYTKAEKSCYKTDGVTVRNCCSVSKGSKIKRHIFRGEFEWDESSSYTRLQKARRDVHYFKPMNYILQKHSHVYTENCESQNVFWLYSVEYVNDVKPSLKRTEIEKDHWAMEVIV